MQRRMAAVGLAIAVMAGCAPFLETRPSVPSTGAGQALRPQSSQPKRVTAAMRGDPTTLYSKVNVGPAGGVAGLTALEDLTNAGLVMFDSTNNLRPQLAEAVPSHENGLWQVFPDGRMETIWRIRAGAAWHDGTPFTPDDLVFTSQVGQDRDLPTFREPRFRFIESLQARDARTLSAVWKEPFIRADELFWREFAFPLPRHLLEKPYGEEKAAFTQLPFWTEEFVGSGPYRVREFVRGRHLLLEANDRYVLGRPGIDLIEVKFIPDANVIMTNILAGTVQLTLGRTLSPDQALQVRSQWQEGGVEVAPWTLFRISSQLINPQPQVIANVQFRRALLYAVDRQLLVDTLQAGLTSPRELPSAEST